MDSTIETKVRSSLACFTTLELVLCSLLKIRTAPRSLVTVVLIAPLHRK